jgi:hypothetical protein
VARRQSGELCGMSCPYLETCPMFRAIALSESCKYLVWAFCCSEHSDCGRYKKIIAGEEVARGLMPTGEIMQMAGDRVPRR